MRNGRGNAVIQLIEFVEISERQGPDYVAELAHDIWTEHFVPIIGEAQVAYMLEHFQSEQAIASQVAEGCQYFIVQIEEGVVGYMALVPETESGRMQLSKLYLLPEDRGKGLGRAMIAFAEQRCRVMKTPTLWLTVNKHNRSAIDFYEHVGFTNAGPIVTDIGGGFVMDDYLMEIRFDHTHDAN